jgi:hypothetical protein
LAAAECVLEAATATLRDLQLRRGDVLARSADLAEARKRVSFLAHTTTGDAAAQLDQLRDQVAEP